jgi:cbb3-type cytochrome oxidase subunit 3
MKNFLFAFFTLSGVFPVGEVNQYLKGKNERKKEEKNGIFHENDERR